MTSEEPGKKTVTSAQKEHWIVPLDSDNESIVKEVPAVVGNPS